MDFEKLLKIVQLLEIDEKSGLKIISGSQLAGRHSLMHTPDENAICEFNRNEFDTTLLAQLVSLVYNPEYNVLLIKDGGEEAPELTEASVNELDEKLENFKEGHIFFRADPSARSFLSFVELIAHLRSPEGCPWDRKQTYQTLRTNLLEETYEVLDAIDNNDMLSLAEELGDLLLQIVLQSQLANETDTFNIYDVIGGIHKKLVFRHPHVFSDWDVEDASTVIKNWEILKSQEREKKDRSVRKSLLDSVPKNLPALSLAQKYQERAARVGFDWTEIAPVIEKIEEEIDELKEAPNAESRERELGDLLFAMVNLIRWYGLDAESVLRQMNQRFLKRFSFIEDIVAGQGKKMTDLTLAEMDEIWEQSKLAEAKAVQNGQ